MKLYRYYTSKEDRNIKKDHVWFYANVHDAAYHADKGVVLEYDIDKSKLKFVPEKYLNRLNDCGSIEFPNQDVLELIRENGYNCYAYKWDNLHYFGTQLMIVDKSLIPTPKRVTSDDIFVQYHYLRREVNNEKLYARFGAQSLYDSWLKYQNRIPSADDTFDGYVEDEIFFNANEEQFEKYVMEHFKVLYENCISIIHKNTPNRCR